jgi:putative oxidoreductase
MFALRINRLWSQWAPMPVRLIIGYGFMAHGFAKWSRGPEGFGKLLHQIGVPFPEFTARAITFLELFGGLAVLVGAFVAIVSVPLAISMLVAMFKVHLRYGFSSINTIGLTAAGPVFGPPGYEVNLLYVGGLLVLILCGAGPWSVDYWLARRKKTRELPNHFRPG